MTTTPEQSTVPDTAELELHIPQQADLSGLDYHELVAQGQATIRVAEATNWVLGDLAAEVETRNTYGKRTLEQYAEDIGVALGTLQSYRTVAKAYPRMSRRLDNSWSVHQAFTRQNDRLELLAEHWTLATARREVQNRAEGRGSPQRPVSGDSWPSLPPTPLPKAGDRASSPTKAELQARVIELEGEKRIFGPAIGGTAPPEDTAPDGPEGAQQPAELPPTQPSAPEATVHSLAVVEPLEAGTETVHTLAVVEPAGTCSGRSEHVAPATCPDCTGKDEQIAAMRADLEQSTARIADLERDASNRKAGRAKAEAKITELQADLDQAKARIGDLLRAAGPRLPEPGAAEFDRKTLLSQADPAAFPLSGVAPAEG